MPRAGLCPVPRLKASNQTKQPWGDKVLQQSLQLPKLTAWQMAPNNLSGCLPGGGGWPQLRRGLRHEHLQELRQLRAGQARPAASRDHPLRRCGDVHHRAARLLRHLPGVSGWPGAGECRGSVLPGVKKARKVRAE